MTKFWLCVLAIFASSIFSSCEAQTKPEAQTKLPKELPPSVEIIYISQGSFAPTFFSPVIAGDTMKVVDEPPDAERKRFSWNAKLNDDDLKNLYQVFVENKFDSIKPNEKIDVPDGKSRSIELKFDGKRFYAVKGDGIETTKVSGERFNNVEKAVGDLVKKHEPAGEKL